jgi:hypothetical protein
MKRSLSIQFVTTRSSMKFLQVRSVNSDFEVRLIVPKTTIFVCLNNLKNILKFSKEALE